MMNESRTNRISHVIGRTGLALLGALSALFVGALVGRTEIGAINSAVGLLGSILYAGLAFYLGIDIPRQAAQSSVDQRVDLALLVGALGTLLASLAAVVALSVFVLDAGPAVGDIQAIGLAWFVGLTMQLIAAALSRMSRPELRPPRTVDVGRTSATR